MQRELAVLRHQPFDIPLSSVNVIVVVVVVAVVAFTVNRPFYPASSVHPASVLIPYAKTFCTRYRKLTYKRSFKNSGTAWPHSDRKYKDRLYIDMKTNRSLYFR